VNEKSGSTNHLKNIFEQSLAVLCEGRDSIRVRRSSLPLHIDAVNLKKRALSEAANALAALWRISEPRPAKPQSRVLQYTR
jgi:hypothetical protein